MQEDTLFVVSWNLLAPIFVRPNEDPNDFAYFGHCSLNDLSWDRRRLLIKERIAEMRPDVLLLQGCGVGICWLGVFFFFDGGIRRG